MFYQGLEFAQMMGVTQSVQHFLELFIIGPEMIMNYHAALALLQKDRDVAALFGGQIICHGSA
ncbi:MAG: hypothetical protein GY927_21565 [bacterium]|nr:hypothetical protein [bacterium]